MRVLLVNPPTHAEVYQDLSKFTALEPPVWAGLIAHYLRQRKYHVEILDAEALEMSAKAAAYEIIMRKPDLAVFCIYGHQPSASTQCMPGAVATLKHVKLLIELGHSAPILTLALGTHPSALPLETLQEGFDYVCQGEGPLTLEALLSATNGKHLLDVPGLWIGGWHNKHSTPWRMAPNITDLDREIPFQAWDLLNMKLYRPLYWLNFTDKNPKGGGYASVQSSLGCPFKCSFCCINAPFGGPGYRMWKPANIAEQIALLVENYGITNIKFPDEMFFLNRQHVKEICNHLITMRLGDQLNMWAYARIDTVKDDALLALARKAGFTWLGIGIESASKHVRDGIEKGRFGNEDILRACERVHGHGIEIGANYIFGLPDDTLGSMQETLDLAFEVNAAYANFYCAMAYPGSQLHKVAKEKGWGLPEDGPGWIGYSQHSYDSMPLRTDALTYQEVLDFRDSAWHRYYTRMEFLAMIEMKFGVKARELQQQINAMGSPKRRHREGTQRT